jgi:hypothetical protein
MGIPPVDHFHILILADKIRRKREKKPSSFPILLKGGYLP